MSKENKQEKFTQEEMEAINARLTEVQEEMGFNLVPQINYETTGIYPAFGVIRREAPEAPEVEKVEAEVVDK